jgi:hypothetical protein
MSAKSLGAFADTCTNKIYLCQWGLGGGSSVSTLVNKEPHRRQRNFFFVYTQST